MRAFSGTGYPKRQKNAPRSGWFGSEEGFTLAELMVVVLIMMVFLVGVAVMVESGAKSSIVSYALARIDEDANKVLDTMTRQIRVATSIYPQSDGSVLAFEGDLQGDGVTRTMVYSASEGTLWRGADPDNLEAWVEGVESIEFTYYRYDTVTKTLVTITPGIEGWNTQVERVDFHVQFSRQAGNVDARRDYTGSVKIRNQLQ